MDAIILAGGKGTRMEDDLPKPLVPVKGKAIIEHQVDYLLSSGVIDHIIVSIGHRADEIILYLEQHFPAAPLLFSKEELPLGTAGAVKQALAHTTAEKNIVFNCDDIVDINLKDLGTNTEDTICVAHPRLPFGLVRSEDGYAQFEEKPRLADRWVSCGWYLFFTKNICAHAPDIGSLEYDVFPHMKLRVYEHVGFWQPLNTKKDIMEFEQGSPVK